jgi:hypothetical protein
MTGGGGCVASWNADHGLIVDAALREARDALFDEQGATSNVAALVELAERSFDS